MSSKKQKLSWHFISLLLVTINKMTIWRKEMFIIGNTCKNVSDLITTFLALFKHLTINIKKLYSQLIEPEAMMKQPLPQNGIFKMRWNFKKKISLKSYSKKLKKMSISSSETIFSILSHVSVFKNSSFKYIPNIKSQEQPNTSWNKRNWTRKIEQEKLQDKQATPTAKVVWPRYQTLSKSHSTTQRINKTQVSANNKVHNPLIVKV